MTEPMAAVDDCEHHHETRLLGGHPLHVRACYFCRQPDWNDLMEQAVELYQWGWQEGQAGKPLREALSAYDKPQPESGPDDLTGAWAGAPPITVKRIGVTIPVTAEQLLDAGLPLPPGMEPPPPTPRPPLYRRLRWAYRERVQAARERLGFWIAGYEPDDSGW